MEEIIQYIEDNNLKSRDRYRHIVYKRYYLSNLLRNNGYTFQEIGKIFNKDHATIVYGVRVHKDFMSIKDNLYLEYTEQERLLFENLTQDYNLVEDIMGCYSIDVLKKIKFRLRNNLYKELILESHIS